MKIGRVNYIQIAFILALLFILYYYFFKDILERSKYGKAANAIREYVKVPIIESDMRKVRLPKNVEGGRWESTVEENGLIHLWKIVSPNNGSYLLDEELDAFKKVRDTETYWQLNISSKILGDSGSIRKGTLSIYKGNVNNSRLLDENNLDSIFTEWGLENLVKGSK